MYTREPKEKPRRKSVIKMDPNCAICNAPATLACDCEAKGLEMAVRQAEDRMMRSIYSDIRSWVRAHAQDYVLEYFRLLAERRKNAHTAHLDQISAHAFYHYNAPPHPNQIADAQAMLKRGIDEDWQASVQRYPEVLEYYFGLVELTLPADDEPAVKDPPLSALNGGSRKAIRRAGTEDESSSSSRAGGSGPFPATEYGSEGQEANASQDVAPSRAILRSIPLNIHDAVYRPYELHESMNPRERIMNSVALLFLYMHGKLEYCPWACHTNRQESRPGEGDLEVGLELRGDRIQGATWQGKWE
ncbi:serine/threonine protein phosphatase [Purpureocillium lilacinum]|uniref:Serine/threonine protein phosphatase n=2 Tax=Purpureocillium lilacinum TaxID=33203 RepID=A0A179H9T6_PURLI|nr:serine/threonine protein phosphatase [Purpureocillium lilacinum]